MNLSPAQAGGQSFSGGQFSAARQSIIPDDAYWLGTCIDNDEFGNAITRRGSAILGAQVGTTSPIQGMTTFYLTPGDASQCTIACSNGLLYYWKQSNSTWNALPASGTAWTQQTGNDKHVHFAQVGGKLFVANGVNNLHSIDWAGAGASEAGATNVDPPAAPTWICNHTNRLVATATGTVANRIYFSQFGNGSVGQWNRTLWSLEVGSNSFDITGMLPWSNFDLFVMKDDSLWVVGCNPTYAVLDFTVQPLHRNIGCPAPRTACQVGTDILLLTRLGVLKIDRSMATASTTEIQEPISKPIQDLINRINWSAVKDNAFAFYFNNRYFLNVPLDQDTTALTTIVYNTVTKKWMGSWGKGMDMHCASVNDGLSPSRLRFGRFDGKVYEWLDYVKQVDEVVATYQDNGVSYGSSVETRAYDFSEPDSYKDLSTLKLEFLPTLSGATPQVDGLVTVGVRLDSAGAISVAQNFNPLAIQSTLPINLPFYLPIPGIKPKKVDISFLPPCLEASAVVSVPSGRLCLRKAIFSAYVGSIGVEVCS